MFLHSLPVGEGTVALMQEWVPVIRRQSDVPSPFADNFDLIPVGCH
jgi:hypothetical protein